ncbi:Ferric-chelate reductase, putative [Penicillium digitatum PHI26]|uniref:ferric-chelate reductase (NADPH) n=2 Tax=Penicillium digitatum TaxID=36651 RepID=K9F5G0_PEND2|nr:Ferric-chelate reductase, putative [Penicillium digitatum Pd1]EKV04259.1 Ferric-chelate reductase, putative [Penicillium digitatum PHI26]EKV21367.1 Ferric-chelate reductase, putative [Penicillium digitatum Pd1]
MGVELKGNGSGEPPMNPTIAVPLFVVSGLIAIRFVWKTVIRIRHCRRAKAARQGTDQTQLCRTNRFNAALKKHLLYAPIWGNRHSREFRVLRLHMGSLPLRLEVICLLIYLSLNLVFIVVKVDWWLTDYSEKMFQLKYAAGHLAVMNTPGLVLGAGRNNPLIQLLGISFDTFNFMHRWVGRVITANAVIHMSAVLADKAYVYGTDYILYVMWQQKLFICGLLRVLLGTLILWGLDRAGRLGILLWRNLSSRPTTATVEVLPGSVARVDVAVARGWRFRPGQYMYLYMPCLGLWTSHPFTVAWSSTSDSLSMNEKRSSGDSLSALSGSSPTTTMSVLIKGQDGFTKKLLRKAEDSTEGRIQAMALAEGPFGGIHSLASYGTLLLIAGGVGITHPMSYLNEVITTFVEQKTATRKVHLVWIVRSLGMIAPTCYMRLITNILKDHLSWVQTFMTEMLGHESLASPTTPNGHSYFQFPQLLLSISLHITSHKDTVEEYIPQPDSLWVQCAPPGVPVSIHHGKPCIQSVLEKEKEEQIGAMAVSVCGPGGLGDSVREAVRSVQGEKTVDLFEETFSW